MIVVNEEQFDEVITTIRTLHQTTIDQRQTNLTSFLLELFQTIENQTNLVKIFPFLTQLLRNYDDRAALKIEFVQSQCFETIERLATNSTDRLVDLLDFVAELIVNSENVHQKFLDFDGYERIFSFLNRISSPPEDFLQRLLILMTSRSTLEIDRSLTPVDLYIQLLNPRLARVLINWIPQLERRVDQQKILHAMNILVSRSVQNRMIACSQGILSTFIDLFDRDKSTLLKQFDDKLVFDTIFSILEKLCRFSIRCEEIRQIFRLFVDKTPFQREFLRVLITAAKHDDPETQTISSYFDFERSNSGILLPTIRRWPSISSSSVHFTFHCWLRLNSEGENYPYHCRRQLYSFYSESIGFEAFFSHSSLYILMGDRRESSYIEIPECDDFIDNCWHSLTIVHTGQRPSLLVAAFQSISTCHLTVYVDGHLKRQVKDFKFVPLINEPISLASIGATSQRPRSSSMGSKSDSILSSTTLAKTIQPFKGLFGSKSTKSNFTKSENQTINSQNVVTIEPNAQDVLFGESTSLHGQLASIWILAETLNETQVKHLHSMGSDFCHQKNSITRDETSISTILFDYLSTRTLLVYHPLACNGQICLDLSTCTSQMNGRLNNGTCRRLRSFSQSLLNLGGCPVLYPLINSFDEKDFLHEIENQSSSSSSSSPGPNETPTDWIFVRNQSQKLLCDIDNRLISNPVASVINLIRCVLSSTATFILADQMTQHYNVELLGQHLNRLSPIFIDQQLLIAIQQLIESCRLISISNFLVNQLIQHLLLEFSLWYKAKFHVRIAHLQYVAAVIKDEKKFYRTKFGVQFFLDVLRQYFNSPEENLDEQKQLRSAIYGILKYFLQRHPRLEEINALLSSISTLSTSNDTITHELLDFLFSLLDPPSTPTDTTIGLLCEPSMSESLYALLTISNLSIETKEIVMKIIKYLIASRRVPQQVRTQLRLETHQIGFGGIISGLSAQQLNVSLVRDILNLIINSDSNVSLHHLNVVLTLCSSASLDVRYVAMRKLMSCFIAHPSLCRSYTRCHGWQETLAHFFVKSSRRSTSTEASANKQDRSVDSGRGSSNATLIDHPTTSVLIPPRVFETSSSPDDPTQQRLVRQLDLSPIIDEMTDSNIPRSLSSPRLSATSTSMPSPSHTHSLADSKDLTPEFLRRNSLDYQAEGTPLHSASTSREDLLSLAKTETSNDDLASITTNSNDPISPVSVQISRTSVTSTEDSSFYIPTSQNGEDGSIIEELSETLILTVVMILWKGIVTSDEQSWILRGQIFSALRYLERENEFYLPLNQIEQRIFELSIETCLNELKLNGGISTPAHENNCRELIKLIDDHLSQSNDNNDRMAENFVTGIFSILDTMLIFEENGTGDESVSTLVSHDEHWTETSLTGLNILLKLLSHRNLSFCGQASVRIHSLLHSRPLNGREEAAYLLSSVNQIFVTIPSTADGEQQFAYLLPVMKTIIDKSYSMLQMNVQIPNVPLHKATSTALDDFRQYSSSSDSQEWQMFIQRHIEPLAENYRSMSIRPFHMNMKIWWNQCHEMMMIGIHKRNRQIGEEKLKFESHIVDQWRSRRRLDHQRMIKFAKQRRIHQIHVEHEWKDRERYLKGERGPWSNRRNPRERHWMLSDRENIHRMRCKFVENDHFDRHADASRLRDNLGLDSIEENQVREKFLSESLKNSHLFIQQEEILRGNSTIDEKDLFTVDNETQSLLLEEKEKIIIGTSCSLITSTTITEGKFEITNKYIYFFDSTPSPSSQNDFKYPLTWLQDVHLRRFNLRPSALEFFLVNQTNFLINFEKKLRREIYQKIISLKLPSMKSLATNLSTTNVTPEEIVKESKLTEKWISREISNFDYLMMLNAIAGRTYNDLNQYPIFPWIIKDFTSEQLDLNDPNIYRDFSRPIGIQNSKHIEEVRTKYESFDDPTGLMKKFHYGTHYSNAASVMHYLIRIEPFTTLHIQLQSGKFDIADRQFHSFQSTWTNIMDSPNDGKELIPEFFYLPEFLRNSNGFDLGKLQITHQKVNDVQLPPWAKNSAEEFIRLHRLALESDYVSSHLHEWIDLIFGFKQTGQPAIDACNVFMYCAYEKAVDLDAIDDPVTREAIEGMIQNFGQIPSQLFHQPHPQRLTREQAAFQIESQGRPLNIFQNLTHIRAFFVEITPSDDKLCDPITFISIPKNQIRSFMQQGIPDTLVTISVNGVVGNHGWQPYDKSLSNFFTFERDPTLQTERSRHIIAAPFSPSIDIKSRLFAVSHDAKFIFSGGHWDWSLRVYSLLKSKMITSIIHHTDVITCLALDSTGWILVTGSRDTTCVIWHLSLGEYRPMTTNNTSTNVNTSFVEQESNALIRPALTLYGHTAEVTSIVVSIELDLVVSGSADGTANLHTVEHGIYLRTLQLSTIDHIVNLKLSDERHILIQTANEQTNLFLYSINGDLIQTKRFEYQVVDMLLSDQHIILAVNHLPSSKLTTKESTTNLVAARIIIKDMFEMKTVQTIRLRTQINCLYFTKDFSHLLVGVKDGKLIVLTAEKKSLAKTLPVKSPT